MRGPCTSTFPRTRSSGDDVRFSAFGAHSLTKFRLLACFAVRGRGPARQPKAPFVGPAATLREVRLSVEVLRGRGQLLRRVRAMPACLRAEAGTPSSRKAL
jgi:hypothetical protein